MIKQHSEEYLKAMSFFHDRIADISSYITADFNKRFTNTLQPTQNDFRELQRAILDNPARNDIVNQMVRFDMASQPIYLISK